MKRHEHTGFTLVEMMIVVAVSLILISITGTFFGDLWLSSSRAITRTGNNQQSLILMQKWQQTINITDPSSWTANDTVFTAADMQIHQDSGSLIIASGSICRKVALPSSAQCTFNIERPEGSEPLAALNVEWIDRRMGSSKKRNIRILAHGKLK